MPGCAFGGHRGLVPSVRKLPSIPDDDEWNEFVDVVRQSDIRDRFMTALAYAAALPREELCSLATTDIDPSHRLLRVRGEITNNQRESVVPFSIFTAALYQAYLAERHQVGRSRGHFFFQRRTETVLSLCRYGTGPRL